MNHSLGRWIRHHFVRLSVCPGFTNWLIRVISSGFEQQYRVSLRIHAVKHCQEYLGWFIHVWQALTEPNVATKNEPTSIFVLNGNRSQFPCAAITHYLNINLHRDFFVHLVTLVIPIKMGSLSFFFLFMFVKSPICIVRYRLSHRDNQSNTCW